MGMAEVVPGVSGGTIAFITGIYERLIAAIRSVTKLPLRIWRQEGFGEFWNRIDGWFLLFLAGGMFLGILVGVLGISYLLDNYPPVVWGFFFGLIIASAIYIGVKIKRWGIAEIVAVLLGIFIAYYITVTSPAEGSDHLLFVFLSGAIAVCALILPGISGSFILLLLGMYTIVLHSAKDLIADFNSHSLFIILVFVGGCIIGLALFSNVLHFLFTKYRFPTLALLTGFMIGSLNRIWPWRNPTLWLNKETGEQINILPPGTTDIEHFQILSEVNVFPSNYEGLELVPGTIICFLLGMGLVWLLSKYSKEDL